MRRLLHKLGTWVFWLAWPGFWLILNNTERSRLLLFNGGELLIMQDWFYDKWALPGGGKHQGESAVEALCREVREELGLELAPETPKPLFSETIRDRGIKVSLDYFVAEVADRPDIKPSSRFEVYDFAWLSPDQLNASNAGVDVLHGLGSYAKSDRGRNSQNNTLLS